MKVLTKNEKYKEWKERIKNNKEYARLYEILAIVGINEFEKDEINIIGKEENVNQN